MRAGARAGGRARGAVFAAALAAHACTLSFDDTGLSDGDEGGGGGGGRAGAGQGGASGGGGSSGRGGGGAGGAGGVSPTGGGGGSGGTGPTGGTGPGGGLNAYEESVLADGPTHYFRLDEPEGSDEARNFVGPATVFAEGAPSFGAEGIVLVPLNSGVRFRAGDILSADVADFKPGERSAFTIEAWVRFDAPPGEGEVRCVAGLESELGDTLSFVATDVELAVELVDSNGQPNRVSMPIAFEPGESRHLSVSFDGDAFQLCEGRPDGASTCSGSQPALLPEVGPLYPVLGNDFEGFCGLGGVLDEVAFYPQALSSERLRAHRQIGFGSGPDEPRSRGF
jgi:hypothetical protein